MHSINKRVQGGNVMVKIDMAKAYDRVHCDFLLKVLEGFGFSRQFCKLVKECVKSHWYSVMMNRTYKGFFKASRGLRQGDSSFSLFFYFDGRGLVLLSIEETI